MEILFCKVPFMKNYCGNEDNTNNEDNIISKFYQEKKGNHPENYLFQDYNGNCYGYVSVKDGIVNLNEIKFTNSDELLIANATVVFVYFDEKINSHIILGWYKNANVYKFLQKSISYSSIGRDLYFNIKAKSENCFLLPVEKRNFNINILFNKNTNIFIATEDSLIEDVLNYIENYSGKFINTIFTEKVLNVTLENSVNNPISLSKRGCIYLYEEGKYYEALKFFNTALMYKDKLTLEQLIDVEYCKGLCLQFLNAFSFAKIQFEKVIDLKAGNYQIYKNLAYLYLITKDYEKAMNMCNKILDEENEVKENPNLLTEINCIKIDILIQMNNFEELEVILNKVINETEDLLLKSHCEKILKELKIMKK